MAEPTAPPVYSPTATRDNYAPYSWLAVAAMVAAVVGSSLIAGFGYWAFRARRPLLEPVLFAIPLMAVALSFAARRSILNSEGTRDGLKLANSAWWTAVISSLGFGAYLFTVEFSVRRDAAAEVERWAGFVTRDEVSRAFHRTLDPGLQSGLSGDDGKRMEELFREPFVAFRQSQVVRVVRRNKGECRFEPGGLREWDYQAKGLNCVYTGTLVCPEGRFTLAVPLRAAEGPATRGADAPAGRQWQISPDQSGAGYVTAVTLTPYGWAVAELTRQGAAVGRGFVVTSAAGRGAQLAAYVEYALGGDPGLDPVLAPLTAAGVTARQAVLGGGGGSISPPAEWFSHTADKLISLDNGSPPSVEQRQKFRLVWRTTGVLPAGGRLRNSPDNGEGFTRTDAALEVRLPVELPMSGADGDLAAARGRLVVACTDAAVLARLKDLKAAADPARGTTEKPTADLALPRATWRVVRVETDFKRVSAAPVGGPGGPE